jgi:uncharacterized protein YndB with AHSA1/START domain
MDTHTMPFGNEGVRLERLLPGPIERVWDYLTDSRKRATWLAAGEFELREGGRIELRFDNDSLSPGALRPERQCSPDSGFTGRITRFDPPRALAFTWEGAGDPSEVTFELAPRDGQVLLTVTHRRLVDRGVRVSVASGWDVHVSILAARLAGETPAPFWPTHARLEREYEARLPR